MAATISLPDEDQRCGYCGSRIFDHDPICVRDCTAGCSSPSYFCNYACLSASVDERDLETGASCRWEPSSDR